jgi:hypothetical protein
MEKYKHGKITKGFEIYLLEHGPQKVTTLHSMGSMK